MKKRLLALTMAAAMTLSLVGCSGGNDTPSGNTSTPSGATESGGLKGSADELYLMNVFVSGVEYWFPVYAGMKDAAIPYSYKNAADFQAYANQCYKDIEALVPELKGSK